MSLRTGSLFLDSLPWPQCQVLTILRPDSDDAFDEHVTDVSQDQYLNIVFLLFQFTLLQINVKWGGYKN